LTFIVASSFFLKLGRERFGATDIALLGALVAAGKQNDSACSTSNEINPVSRPIVDAQLADAFANRFHIAEQARLQSNNSLGDPSLGVGIAQTGKPMFEQFGLPDFDYVSLVDHTE
jgi:hypothetical protein